MIQLDSEVEGEKVAFLLNLYGDENRPKENRLSVERQVELCNLI